MPSNEEDRGSGVHEVIFGAHMHYARHSMSCGDNCWYDNTSLDSRGGAQKWAIPLNQKKHDTTD